ncbi:hypothetical protein YASMINEVIRUS_1331 [Yasminevirus sp. GU-2018]|uniref:Uncharacterized protein n=1 Tax=Yasminevirus sp. GU-2018 TaxID=2420051 RepID=A0A5K0U9P1_9VIRU|nr:hypothetical protein YASMINEVIRUS_1331 [Yasminevirus sp. GU-2018]
MHSPSVSTLSSFSGKHQPIQTSVHTVMQPSSASAQSNVSQSSKSQPSSKVTKQNGNNQSNESYISYIDSNRNALYIHLSIILILTIAYAPLYSSTTLLYYWISMLSLFLGAVYCVLTSVYALRVTDRWRSQLHDGFNVFRSACVDLSIRNYRLMREYREVYHYHYGDVLSRCTEKYKNGELKSVHSNKHKKTDDEHESSINEYVSFVLQNDPSEKLESYEWIKSSVDRINQYVKLCYYLSFIRPTDKLETVQGLLRVNIGSESVLNTRNRKLESLINEVPNEYKNELLSAWNNIDKRVSHDTLITIPCKWIVYEYRNMFRYLYCAKYLKMIHESFDKDYVAVEEDVSRIGHSLRKLFSRESEFLPRAFTDLYTMLTDTVLFVMDNFVAMTIVNCFTTSGSVLVPVVMGVILQTVFVCVVASISDLVKRTDRVVQTPEDIENIDSRIENVFDEMRVTLFDGKIKKAF